jgi:asparagine N-glycosylation enzyme membrane subunit Stt3
MALAPLYRLVGSSLRVAKSFNAAVGALTVLPVFYLGRRLRGDGAGLIAGGLVAIAPSLVFWTASLFSETLFTLGVASTLAAAAWAGAQRRVGAYFIAGLVLSATAFVRSQGTHGSSGARADGAR